MPAKMRIQAVTDDQAIKDLTTRVETLEKKTVGAGRAAKHTSSALSEMAKNAGEFALGLAGVASVGEVVKKIIEAAKEDFRQLLDMQKGAAEAQQTMYEATGTMVQSANLTPRQVEEWRTFAESQGAQLGKQGAVDIIRARAALGGEDMGESETVKRSVMERAVAAKAQNRNVDLNQYFTALMHMLDAFGGDLQLADNMLIASQQSGMTLETISKNLPTIKALAAETGASLPEVMTKAALIGTQLGEEGTGTLRKLLMGGGGNDKSKVALAQHTLARSAEAQADIEARFAEAAAPGANLRADIERSLAETPGAAGIAAGRLAAGTAESAQAGDLIGGEWERVRERMKSFEAQYGIRTGFDFTKTGRQLAGIYSGQNPLDWERQERQRLLSKKLSAMTPGTGGYGAEAFETGAAAAANPYGGMSESEMLKSAVLRGAVSPEGGISSAEGQALATVGIDKASIDQWNQMFLDGLTEKLAESFAKALREAQASPAPNALNPGT